MVVSSSEARFAICWMVTIVEISCIHTTYFTHGLAEIFSLGDLSLFFELYLPVNSLGDFTCQCDK